MRPISLVDPFLLSQNHLPPPKKTAGFSPNLKDASQTPGPGAYVVRRDFDKARSRAVFQSPRSTPPQRGPTALARHAPGSVPSKAQQPVALAQATMPTGRCCVMGFVNSGYEIGSVKWKQAPRICAPDSPRPDTHAMDLPPPFGECTQARPVLPALPSRASTAMSSPGWPRASTRRRPASSTRRATPCPRRPVRPAARRGRTKRSPRNRIGQQGHGTRRCNI